jgi:hypothetical protein
MLNELAQDGYVFISKCSIRRYQQTLDFLGFIPLSREAVHFMETPPPPPNFHQDLHMVSNTLPP